MLDGLKEERARLSGQVRQAGDLAEDPRMLEELEALLENAEGNSACYLKGGRKSLRRQFRKLRKAHRAWVKSGDEEALHEIRIRLKKFRYTAETYAPLYDSRMKRFIRGLKEAQEILGDWNDHRILRDYVVKAESAEAGNGRDALRIALEERVAALLEIFVERAGEFFSREAWEAGKGLVGDMSAPCCLEKGGA